MIQPVHSILPPISRPRYRFKIPPHSKVTRTAILSFGLYVGGGFRGLDFVAVVSLVDRLDVEAALVGEGFGVIMYRPIIQLILHPQRYQLGKLMLLTPSHPPILIVLLAYLYGRSSRIVRRRRGGVDLVAGVECLDAVGGEVGGFGVGGGGGVDFVGGKPISCYILHPLSRCLHRSRLKLRPFIVDYLSH